ncbi:MAG: hypothetical protein HND53_12165 [Proteobacteria bacterium]|nr:hypothetical protein [Pseudomonadota bacterium]NOG61249.1 hypothetical protein [Pseudomonadota bacterium]
MSITTEDLEELASLGGGMILDSKIYNVDELLKIATKAKGTNARITIKHALSFTHQELNQIASACDGNVIFDLS